MYANENNDRLVNDRTADGTEASLTDNWVADKMGYTPQQDTNTLLLQQGLLAPYVGKNIGIYHCPADTSPRVRSVSMNAFVGPYDNAGTPAISGWAQFVKLSAIRSPSMIFVFLDESPQTINDGWYEFCADGPTGSRWSDLPASYHNRAGSLSFADGHSEIKRWIVNSTVVPFTTWPVPTGPDKRDFQWLSLRATYSQ